MRIESRIVYELAEHPHKELCFEWVRDNWHDLNQHSISDLIKSLRALCKKVGGTFDYSIGANPCQGEFIAFNGYDKSILAELKKDDLPLTGVCWDFDVIEGLRKNDFTEVFEALHQETEYRYSDEGLTDCIEANNCEFYDCGKMA